MTRPIRSRRWFRPRVLTPRAAVVWAAFFNFVAFLLFESTVASNIAHGVSASVVSLTVVASGLIGALVWDILTWKLALPSSSSHALLGGFAGAAVVKAGFGSLDLHFLGKTALFIVLSPLLGLLLGALVMRLLMALFGNRSPRFVDHTFRRGQLVSAALYSLGHGGNDAQKTMGIITAALIATGHLTRHTHDRSVPLWVVLSCHAAMALGTMTGGWRIVRTLGMGVAKLQPVGGFAAETSGALTLFIATKLGIPVSTTHTIARRDHGRRQRDQVERGALGRGRSHALGLGAHHPRRGRRRGRHVPARLCARHSPLNSVALAVGRRQRSHPRRERALISIVSGTRLCPWRSLNQRRSKTHWISRSKSRAGTARASPQVTSPIWPRCHSNRPVPRSR